jgi:hypothetical protein
MLFRVSIAYDLELSLLTSRGNEIYKIIPVIFSLIKQYTL